jgi:hypothetical protein
MMENENTSYWARQRMKKFQIHLRDGRIVTVEADTYRREGSQYVFDKADSSEVQFFVDSEVTGIVEIAPPLWPRQTTAEDGFRYF